MNATNPDDLDVGHDLEIKKVIAYGRGGGTWVRGTLSGHSFDALVFLDHAACPDWELGGDSRISKLFIRRLDDRRITFNWDRGPDVMAADDTTLQIVDFLAGGLADHIYH